jgi:hypothetical protein
LTALDEQIAAIGFTRAHRWWQPARACAASEVVIEHAGAVIAFGAGHSHYEDLTAFAVAQRALAGCFVVLLMPDRDDAMSLAELRRRSIESKDETWIKDGHDHLAAWSTSEQNRRLADVTVYSAGLTVEAYAAAIASAVA